MLRVVALSLALLVATLAGAASAQSPLPCIRLTDVTAFPPRDEVYVRIAASCSEEHFEQEDPVQGYLEVMVSDLPPVGRDVRIYPDESGRSMTLDFRGLGIESGDAVLVRLLQYGEIVDLRTVLAP